MTQKDSDQLSACPRGGSPREDPVRLGGLCACLSASVGVRDEKEGRRAGTALILKTKGDFLFFKVTFPSFSFSTPRRVPPLTPSPASQGGLCKAARAPGSRLWRDRETGQAAPPSGLLGSLEEVEGGREVSSAPTAWIPLTALTGILQTCSGSGEESRCWRKAQGCRGARWLGQRWEAGRSQRAVPGAGFVRAMALPSSNWLTGGKLLTFFHSQFLQLLNRDNNSIYIMAFLSLREGI